ncbi:MAG: hypothetical protein V7K14_26050 [Nostoc sp.]
MNATCFNGGTPLRVMPPARQGRTPVAYGGKPAYSARLTATQWLPMTKD